MEDFNYTSPTGKKYKLGAFSAAHHLATVTDNGETHPYFKNSVGEWVRRCNCKNLHFFMDIPLDIDKVSTSYEDRESFKQAVTCCSVTFKD
jgi:hypothetical protein